ncbi:substrate-binding domain-containing protein [Conexibacter woesei]|uniref:ABC-type sugar transport system periplasmic component-like protein n=1 Tax=Conexibacter woesei (strain DSM 14684 / CCUG 47730 / CIP 108061 / JCM 11494 / NBRC 100937 / ID131577) TaxID=469383 RepID=D3F3J1_CONWI|nr:substrate-binding domain-containing protein [Conexibacter woesei]ADB52356.1 ABC-type sugar transport system periplasmic component-like protein [Conexibacter woesei DSM 14684]
MSKTRAVTAAVAALLIAVTAGCGSSTGGSGDDSAGSTTGGGDAATSAVGKQGTVDQLRPMSDYCGDRPITVGIAFGFAGNTWYNVARAEFEAAAKECPNIEKVLYADGQNNAQKAISDIQSLVAQGADALVVFPNVNSKAMLPAIRAATQRGVKVVPAVASPGGEPGKDYVDFVGQNSVNDGRQMAEFAVRALRGRGNVVFLGGTPGNTQSAEEFEGAKEVFDANPDIRILGGRIVDTNWDVAQYPRIVGGLLTKYGDIDAVLSDYGSGAAAGMRAFVSAGKPLPVFTGSDGNEFSCMYERNKRTSPDMQIATMSSRPWITRVALAKAVAAAEGVPNEEPSLLDIPLVEDSVAGGEQAPRCDESLPPDFFWSSRLTKDEQLKAFG